MDKQDIQKLINLRAGLIKSFERLRDYKNNKNAIMKEVEHAALISSTISQIDDILKVHVTFK